MHGKTAPSCGLHSQAGVRRGVRASGSYQEGTGKSGSYGNAKTSVNSVGLRSETPFRGRERQRCMRRTAMSKLGRRIALLCACAWIIVFVCPTHLLADPFQGAEARVLQVFRIRN